MWQCDRIVEDDVQLHQKGGRKAQLFIMLGYSFLLLFF